MESDTRWNVSNIAKLNKKKDKNNKTNSAPPPPPPPPPQQSTIGTKIQPLEIIRPITNAISSTANFFVKAPVIREGIETIAPAPAPATHTIDISSDYLKVFRDASGITQVVWTNQYAEGEFDLLKWLTYPINLRNVVVDPSGNFVKDANGNYTFDLSGVDISGATYVAVPIPDFADHELERDLSSNKNGMTSFSINAGGCVLGKKFDANVRITSNLTADEEAQVSKIHNGVEDQVEEHDTIAQASQQIENIVENIKANFFVRIFLDNLRYLEFPFLYWRWIVKKLGIGFCRLIAAVNHIPEAPENETRFVISKMNAIFSFLISILVTYNWFFLMYYEFNGERPTTWNLSNQRFKDKIGWMHYLFEFILYPMEWIDKFMLQWFPNVLHFLVPNNTIKFFVLYILTFQMVYVYGGCTIDLFYDSFKIFLNHFLKPWDEIMHHRYNDGGSPGGTRYSITLKTYWFFHFLVFGAQIPSLIPTFYAGVTAAGEAASSAATMMGDKISKSFEGKDKDEEVEVEESAREEGKVYSLSDPPPDLLNLTLKGMYRGEIAKIIEKVAANRMPPGSFYNLNKSLKEQLKPLIIEEFHKKQQEYLAMYEEGDMNADTIREYLQEWKSAKKMMENYIMYEYKQEQPGFNLVYQLSCPGPDIDKKGVMDELVESYGVFANTKESYEKRLNAWKNYVSHMEYCRDKVLDPSLKVDVPDVQTPAAEEGAPTAPPPTQPKQKVQGGNVITRTVGDTSFKAARAMRDVKSELFSDKDDSMDFDRMKDKAKRAFRDAPGSLYKGTKSVASTLASGAKYILNDLFRFFFSHYYITISAMLFSFYLVFYSVFGIMFFSRLGFFATISQIDKYIRQTSGIIKVEDSCGMKPRGHCRGTIIERFFIFVWELLRNVVFFFANHIYVAALSFLAIIAMFEYKDIIKSSDRFKYSLMATNGIVMVLILAIYTIKKILLKSSDKEMMRTAVIREPAAAAATAAAATTGQAASAAKPGFSLGGPGKGTAAAVAAATTGEVKDTAAIAALATKYAPEYKEALGGIQTTDLEKVLSILKGYSRTTGGAIATPPTAPPAPPPAAPPTAQPAPQSTPQSVLKPNIKADTSIAEMYKLLQSFMKGLKDKDAFTKMENKTFDPFYIKQMNRFFGTIYLMSLNNTLPPNLLRQLNIDKSQLLKIIKALCLILKLKGKESPECAAELVSMSGISASEDATTRCLQTSSIYKDTGREERLGRIGTRRVAQEQAAKEKALQIATEKEKVKLDKQKEQDEKADAATEAYLKSQQEKYKETAPEQLSEDEIRAAELEKANITMAARSEATAKQVRDVGKSSVTRVKEAILGEKQPTPVAKPPVAAAQPPSITRSESTISLSNIEMKAPSDKPVSSNIPLKTQPPSEQQLQTQSQTQTTQPLQSQTQTQTTQPLQSQTQTTQPLQSQTQTTQPLQSQLQQPPPPEPQSTIADQGLQTETKTRSPSTVVPPLTQIRPPSRQSSRQSSRATSRQSSRATSPASSRNSTPKKSTLLEPTESSKLKQVSEELKLQFKKEREIKKAQKKLKETLESQSLPGTPRTAKTVRNRGYKSARRGGGDTPTFSDDDEDEN